jgi:23S rRNA maturation-related 3'-5' exoribonuclease YhaM
MYFVAYKPNERIAKGSYVVHSSDDEEAIRQFLDKLGYEECRTAIVIQGKQLILKGRDIIARGNDETAS